MTRRQVRLTRDGLIMAAAMGLAAYEIVLGDGRAAVLAFLGTLLTAPWLAAADRARRRNGNGNHRSEVSQ